MLRALKHSTSFNNFARCANMSGQIATLLIIITVMLLIFVMVTLNIGQTSLNATVIANAADDGALFLASELATKARQLYDSLGGKEKYCVSTGLASMILAIVVAIIVIVIVIMTAGAGTPLLVFLAQNMILLMAAGAVGGAIGGAVGGAIAGTGAARGAIQGAAIGAAIGGIASGVAGMAGGATATVGAGATVPGATGGTVTGASQGAVVGGTATAAAAEPVAVGVGTVLTQGAYVYSGTVTVALAGCAGFGSAAMGALSLGGAAYNQYASDQAIEDVMNAYATALSQASEKVRMREMMFLRTIMQVVDDPNQVQDQHDINNNGDRFDFVSEFNELMIRRSRAIRDAAHVVRQRVESVVNSNLGWLQSAIDELKSVVDEPPPGRAPNAWAHIVWGDLEVGDYRIVTDEQAGTMTISDNTGNDGILPMGFRSFLYGDYPQPLNAGQVYPIFRSGPTAADYQGYLNGQRQCIDADTCAEGNAALAALPVGFDQVDMVQAGIRDVISWLEMLLAMDPKERAASYDTWIGYFYDEADEAAIADPDTETGINSDTGYEPQSIYGELWKYARQIRVWGNRMVALNPGIPQCVPDDPAHPTRWVNAPCRIGTDPLSDFGDYFWYIAWWTRGGELDFVYPISFDNELRDEFFQFFVTYRRLGGTQDVITATDVAQGIDLDMKRGLLREIANHFKEMSTSIDDAMGGQNLDQMLDGQVNASLSGENPMVYDWSDSRGGHTVSVSTGAFEVPRTKKYKTGNWFIGKTCIKLDRKTSNCADPDSGQCAGGQRQDWVQVNRRDRSTTLGVLGTFNPLQTGNVHKRSYFFFDHGTVRLDTR